MGYEIPQELEYQEIIMFGLTFKQLMYAFVFGSISVLILKANGSIYVKVVLAMIPLTMALGFMYLDFGTHLKNWWIWKKFREADIDDPRMENYFGVTNIKDKIIFLEDKKVAVLKVMPMNFAIKTEDEQGAIIKAFQKFLNSIDFPVQIVMNTDKLDLKGYIDYLSKSKSKFVNYFSKYKENLNQVLKKEKVMNRLFYLVIPEQADIGIQVKICEEKLRSLGLKTTRLDNDELKELLALFCGGERNKWEKEGENKLHEFITPNTLENKKDYIRINDTINRVVCAHGYPRHVEEGFLDKIIGSTGNFDLSIHISPYPIETMMIGLNRELQKQRADLYASESKGIINPSLEIKYRDTRNILEELQKGKEKLFNISLYINCKVKIQTGKNYEKIKKKLAEKREKLYSLGSEDDKKENAKKIKKLWKEIGELKEGLVGEINENIGTAEKELNLLTKKVEAELNALMIIPKVPRFRMAQGFKSMIPLAIDELKVMRNITTHALSAFFPFTSPFLQIDKGGVWFGVNKNNIPIIRDVFKLSNPNGTILATSGAGKSYLSKLFIARNLLNGVKVMVIDPQGEYSNLTKCFSGQIITIDRESDTMINPLDLMGHDYADKRLALMDIMHLMLGNLTDPQKAFLDKALTMTYKKKGITSNPKTWKNEPPTIKDLLKALITIKGRVTNREKATLRSLMNRLEMYVSGVFGFVNKQTEINFDNQFVSFNIKDMPKQVKPLMMFLILDYIHMKMKKDLRKKILVIDEAWSLLSRTEEASYIFEIVKTCRKFNLGLLLINQEVEGLFKSDAGRSVLANSAYTLLLRQKPAVIRNIQNTFNLSDVEKDRLLTAAPGEGILIMDNEHSEIRVTASQDEHQLITTKPEEIETYEVNESLKNEDPKIENIEPKVNGKMKQKKKESKKVEKKSQYKKVKIRVNEFGRFYKKSDLNKDEIKFLADEGYKESSHISFNGKRQESYLLKPRHNESSEHFFLIFDIARYLKKFVSKVDIFTTSRPDIEFEVGNKKYAIEVETGTMYQKARQELYQRVKVLNKKYGPNWFFVLTDYTFKNKYEQLGKTFLRKEVQDHLSKILPRRESKGPTASKGH